jgi:hypothetical protein
MDLYSFIEDHAILNIDQLHLVVDQPIWIVLMASYNNQDYHSVKIPWIHDGIFDHFGQKYNNDYDPGKIYLCRNKENHNEYISVHDFTNNSSNSNNFNLMFTDEKMADTLNNIIIITRSQSYNTIQQTLDEIVETRSFSIKEHDNYSIFDIISVTDKILLNLIPR